MTKAAFGYRGDTVSYAHDFDFLLSEMSKSARRFVPFYSLLPTEANKKLKICLQHLHVRLLLWCCLPLCCVALNSSLFSVFLTFFRYQSYYPQVCFAPLCQTLA